MRTACPLLIESYALKSTNEFSWRSHNECLYTIAMMTTSASHILNLFSFENDCLYYVLRTYTSIPLPLYHHSTDSASRSMLSLIFDSNRFPWGIESTQRKIPLNSKIGEKVLNWSKSLVESAIHPASWSSSKRNKCVRGDLSSLACFSRAGASSNGRWWCSDLRAKPKSRPSDFEAWGLRQAETFFVMIVCSTL